MHVASPWSIVLLFAVLSAARKHPWYFMPTDAELFALAGITSVWNGIRSVALITTSPNSLMEPIHDRMPLIVAPGDYPGGLERGEETPMAFVPPSPASHRKAHRVAPRVSRPENDDASLI